MNTNCAVCRKSVTRVNSFGKSPFLVCNDCLTKMFKNNDITVVLKTIEETAKYVEIVNAMASTKPNKVIDDVYGYYRTVDKRTS